MDIIKASLVIACLLATFYVCNLLISKIPAPFDPEEKTEAALLWELMVLGLVAAIAFCACGLIGFYLLDGEIRRLFEIVFGC